MAGSPWLDPAPPKWLLMDRVVATVTCRGTAQGGTVPRAVFHPDHRRPGPVNPPVAVRPRPLRRLFAELAGSLHNSGVRGFTAPVGSIYPSSALTCGFTGLPARGTTVGEMEVPGFVESTTSGVTIPHGPEKAQVNRRIELLDPTSWFRPPLGWVFRGQGQCVDNVAGYAIGW